MFRRVLKDPLIFKIRNKKKEQRKIWYPSKTLTFSKIVQKRGGAKVKMSHLNQFPRSQIVGGQRGYINLEM
jgi:hypothetical protein